MPPPSDPAAPRRAPSGRLFVSPGEIAADLGIAVRTLWKRVAEGAWPPPWLDVGPRGRRWRREHYREYISTGKWPKEAWRERKGR